MMLWVDIGNSRIKLGAGAPGEMRLLGAVDWRGADAERALNELMAANLPIAAVVSSVAGGQPLALLNAALEESGCTDITVYRKTTRDLLGLSCGYRDRAQLGVDRWFAMLGAWRRHRGALCVVDLGTAGTADLIDANGQHLGGCIFAGVDTQRQALAAGTAQLPATDRRPESVFTDTTESAIAAGTALSVAATVERACAEAQNRVGGELLCCLTGGGVEAVLPLMRHKVVHEPLLVLDGIAAAWTAERT